MLLYDISNARSFEELNYWWDEINRYATESARPILVGAKKDLEDHRQVSHEMGIELADKLQLPIVETSSKTGENVEQTLLTLLELILEAQKESLPPRYVPSEAVLTRMGFRRGPLLSKADQGRRGQSSASCLTQ